MHAPPATRPPLAIALAILCACGAQQDAVPAPLEAFPGALEAQLRQGLAQSVIVALDTGLGDAAAAAAPAGARDALGARVAASGDAYEAAKVGVLAAAPAGDVVVLHRYAALPALHLQLRSAAALEALRARPEVTGVFPDAANEAFLAQSLPLIGQPAAAAAGATGAGTAVAVLDTGLDYTREAFGRCSAPGAPGCRVKYVADFASGDHVLDASGHGTNVAAIVAGVAPGADLIGLDVFNGQYASTSDVLAAIDWCVRNRAAYNIVAINMSLGSGGSTGPCTDGFYGGIHAARAAGIVVVAAAGNDGHADRISSPACSPDAVSVGAVYDGAIGGLAYSSCTDASTLADQVACFSNSSRYLTLLAPGALISAAGVTMAGTSQAAPHVAGAIAVLRSANPRLGGDAAVARLRATGRPITDPRSGVVTPRLDLSSVAVQGCAAGLSGVGSGSMSGQGGTAILSLSIPPSCAWTAGSSAGWLRVSPASGTGGAALTLTATPNPGAGRTATLTVGGRAVTIGQEAHPPAGAPRRAGSPGRVEDRGASGPGTLVR